ncbi:hypothetical protein RHECNPAF_7500106 [Rhizobium etli CNPAF512]|nr:hypothetical protein RHECNPAF_7500106 [Rhizobium etli CNPAF512]
MVGLLYGNGIEQVGREAGRHVGCHHSAASAIGAGEKSSGKCVIALMTG